MNVQFATLLVLSEVYTVHKEACLNTTFFGLSPFTHTLLQVESWKTLLVF